MLNKVILIGHVGTMPELKQAGDHQVAKFSLATKRMGKKDVTDWHDIELWGKSAEFAAEYVQKGKKVCVEGSLHVEKWRDREGNYKHAFKVSGNTIVLLDRMEKTGEKPVVELADDDIPF